MKKLLILFCLIGAGCSSVPSKQNAIISNTGDAITTLAAVSQGHVELNPLGPAGVIIAKPIVYYAITQQPKEDRAKYFSVYASAGWFGTGNNLCVLAGGGMGCLLVGMISGIVSWQSSSLEREYWEMCKRVIHKDPNDEC
jgi:hypothetical protein